VRVYPGAIRIDSSNFNPAPYWAAGVQMAALNVQTVGVAMHINRAMFRQNGNCGFVLKPKRLRGTGQPSNLLSIPRDKEAEKDTNDHSALSFRTEVFKPDSDLILWLSTCGGRCAPLPFESKILKNKNFLQMAHPRVLLDHFSDKPVVLSVSILGAFSLGTVFNCSSPSNPLESANRRLSTILFVCAVSVIGDPGDCKRVLTRSVHTLGSGRGAWSDETFEFVLKQEDVSVLYLSIHLDSDPNLDAELDGWNLTPASGIAHFAAPVSCLRGGVRNCPLSDPSGREIPCACLLCRFSARL
jgi:hypothetical protein